MESSKEKTELVISYLRYTRNAMGYSEQQLAMNSV
jgi:hypothetical protein